MDENTLVKILQWNIHRRFIIKRNPKNSSSHRWLDYESIWSIQRMHGWSRITNLMGTRHLRKEQHWCFDWYSYSQRFIKWIW